MTSSTGAGPSGASLGLLRLATFRRVWIAGTLNGVVRWLEFLAIGVYVFQATGSALLTAAVTMVRLLPLALFGAFAGAIAERVGRRRLYLGCSLVMVAVSLLQAVLAATGAIELWHIAVGAFLAGGYWAIDLPARRTMLGRIAGSERIAAAMGLDAATNNATRMVGPMLGGLLLETIGLGGAFLLATVLYGASFWLVFGLGETGEEPAGGPPRKVLASVLDGIRIARNDRRIVGLLMVTVIFNVWAFPVTSMVPVMGKDVLGLSAGPVGLLMSAEGAGAFAGALLVALFGRPALFNRMYWGGCLLYLVTVAGFAFSTSPALSGAILVVTGVGGAAFAAMQSTLVYMAAPPEARSRMMGVLSACIGTGPIGFLHLGLMAEWLGTPLALAVMAVEGIVGLALVWRYWPEIR